MTLQVGSFLLVAWLAAASGLPAEQSAAAAEITDQGCQSQLEKTKADLHMVQQANLEKAASINLAAKDTSGGLLGELLGSSPAPASMPGPKVGKQMIQPKYEGPEPGEPHWPANRQDYVPPLTEYFFQLKTWLETTKEQMPVVGVVVVFGFINVVFGQAAFRLVVALGFALVTVASTHYEVMMIWPDLTVAAQLFILAEVALLTGWIVYQSFQGAKMVLGFLFGMLISALWEATLHTENWAPNFSVGWYSAWALIGVLMFTALEKYTMAVLTPVVGGFLLSSSLGYIIMFATYSSPHHPTWMHPEGDCWLDFAGALLGSQKPAGVIGTIETPGFVTPSINVDKVLGRLLWFFIFYTGMKLQWKLAKVAPKKFLK
jgi:hypothetical protein